MTRKWAYIIVFTVVMIALWSGWQVYRAFKEEKDVGQYEKYVSPITRELDADLIRGIADRQSQVLVKSSDIAPQEDTSE